MKKLLAVLLTLCLLLPLAAFAEEACTHEGTSTLSDWYVTDPYDVVDLGEEGHTYTGLVENCYYCSNCGENWWEVTDEEKTITEDHYYDENGICWLCGHENPCTHPSTYEYIGVYDSGDAVYESVDNLYHKITGAGFRAVFCEVCGQQMEWEELGEMTKEDYHYYVDGVCVNCGHVNDCQHKNTSDSVIWDDVSKLRYSVSNDNQHRITGPGTVYTYCPDCNTTIKVEHRETVAYGDHWFDGTVCRLCGYDRAAATEEAAEEEKPAEDAGAEEEKPAEEGEAAFEINDAELDDAVTALIAEAYELVEGAKPVDIKAVAEAAVGTIIKVAGENVEGLKYLFVKDGAVEDTEATYSEEDAAWEVPYKGDGLYIPVKAK